MRRLNVRCCCQPTKILGTLPWDERSRETRWVVERSSGDDRLFQTFVLRVEPMRSVACDVPPSVFNVLEPGGLITEELAYKAEGAPIETLRLIKGFIEGDQDHESQ